MNNEDKCVPANLSWGCCFPQNRHKRSLPVLCGHRVGFDLEAVQAFACSDHLEAHCSDAERLYAVCVPRQSTF